MPSTSARLHFKYGLASKYAELTAKDANTIYFLTDTAQIFVGDAEYTRPVQHGSALPEGYNPPNSIFIVESDTDKAIYYSKDGTAWEKVGISASDLTSLTARIAALESAKHTHSNKSVLDGISSAKVSGWDAKVGSVAAGNASVTVGGTATAPTVAVKLSATPGILSLGADGLKAVAPAAAEYSIVKASDSGDYSAVYHLTKNGTNVGTAINIPKDMVVSSGTVETKSATGAWGPAGTYLVLTLANATADKVYINVGDLIEYVTSGSATTDAVVIAVDGTTHKVTASLTDGKITLAKLESSVQTKINQAHTHSNKTTLDKVTETKLTAWDGAATKAATNETAISNHEERIAAMEAIDHTHTNKTVLDGITSAKVSAWDAKQNTLVFNTAYNAISNKVATMTDVNNAALVWEAI